MRRCECRERPRGEEGAALLATLMAVTLMTVLANVLLLATMTEAMIASSWRDGIVARYRVEGAAERAIDASRDAADWRLLAAQSTRWAFADAGGEANVHATGASLDNGVETLELTAQAIGPGGAVRTMVVVIARDAAPVSGQIRLISWRENP